MDPILNNDAVTVVNVVRLPELSAKSTCYCVPHTVPFSSVLKSRLVNEKDKGGSL